MTIITILLVLALAFTFAIALHLVLESRSTRLIGERLDPGASTTRGILFDRNGARGGTTERRSYPEKAARE